MLNKEIQEQRMKNYFIQATKEILKGEGLRAVSVRNVADRAGYSYATLYNYFKDIKDLIFECVKDFQEEGEEFVTAEVRTSTHGMEKIKSITKAYMKYFIQYPGIFELFYIEKTINLVNKQPTIDLINTFLDRLCTEEWEYLIKNKILKRKDADIIKSKLRYLVPGILLLYLTRGNPATYKEFINITNEQLDDIIKIK